MPPSSTASAPSIKKTDPSKGGTVHAIGIAGIKAVVAPDMVRTVLGSCIGVALFDPVAKIGGMCHVILPDSEEGSGDPGKFADTAVDLLVEALLSLSATRERIIAKMAGGAAMFGTDDENTLGRRNAAAVETRLTHHGIRLAASVVGGVKGRKMMLDPATGNVHVEIIGAAPEVI